MIKYLNHDKGSDINDSSTEADASDSNSSGNGDGDDDSDDDGDPNNDDSDNPDSSASASGGFLGKVHGLMWGIYASGQHQEAFIKVTIVGN